MGKMINAYKSVVLKCEGKKLFRRPRDRWEDNIRMNFREVV
jgi:hypothetical protein